MVVNIQAVGQTYKQILEERTGEREWTEYKYEKERTEYTYEKERTEYIYKKANIR